MLACGSSHLKAALLAQCVLQFFDGVGLLFSIPPIAAVGLLSIFVHVHPITFYALLVGVSEPLLTPWQLPRHRKLLVLLRLHIADTIHLLSVFAVWIRSPRPHQLPVSFLAIFDKRHMVQCFSTSTLHWLCTLTPCASANCTLWKIFRFHISVTSDNPWTFRFRHAADHCCHHSHIPWDPAYGMQELDCKHMHPSLSVNFSSMMHNHAYSQGGPSCFIVNNNNDASTGWSYLSARLCLFEPMPLVHHLLSTCVPCRQKKRRRHAIFALRAHVVCSKQNHFATCTFVTTHRLLLPGSSACF